ncbi:hypothetical protein E2986_08902 [Frieseomelitta varia]|uniref:Chitin-binding type-2 domain-containing protein n=1 Tax=Frieseomelitta varia TaxID=561572 RepID=A0A833VMQ7_9HYME|nr:hypothetical protein E2986_08902 [Frieseomelitta varia]
MESVWSHMAEFHRRNQNSMNRPLNYLDFDNLPETNFSCQGKVIGGYYADVEAGCQMFHVCTIGQKGNSVISLLRSYHTQGERHNSLFLQSSNAISVCSLHENSEEDVDQSDSIDDHQRTTSARPTTTTTTSTTTSKPSKPSTTPSSGSFTHPAGYPQHFQPQPPFPHVHTSQSKSLYDDKNGGYHHQYIFHNGERTNNQQATSYQLFSNQGVSSTTVQPPQVHHQIRFSSTSTPQIIHNEPSTAAPLFHATSSTIQTLLNSAGNSPALINPIFHNHGIASTTEQFIHSNNPRETSDYRENGEQSIRSLETNKGKVSKLTISTVPAHSESSHSVQTKTSSQSSQSRISGNFLPTPTPDETTVRSFYPTPRTSSKPPQASQSTSEQVAQTHIHVLPPVQIPQLKPHQITINLPPPDLQRIVQNPSSLLPSQSRVIVTAKASVSDESGRPLNTTQLVTLPLPTIPASYDDYKEGDESFDPFYRDVPKIRNSRRLSDGGAEESRRVLRFRRSVGQAGSFVVPFLYGGESLGTSDRKRETDGFGTPPSRFRRSVGQTKSSMVSFVYAGDSKGKRDEQATAESRSQSFPSIRDSLMRFRDILFGGDFTEDAIRSVFEGSRLQGIGSDAERNSLRRDSLEDLETKASKNFKARDYEEDGVEESRTKQSRGFEIPLRTDTKESDAEEYIDTDGTKNVESDSKDLKDEKERPSDARDKSNDEHESDSKREKPEGALDVVIVDSNEHTKLTSKSDGGVSSSTEKRQVSTEIPTISTTEEIIGVDSMDKQDSESSKHVDDAVKDRGQSESKNDNGEKSREEERRKTKERKPAARRKSSRVRNSRGKISSRRKEIKVESNEPILGQKVETAAVTANSDSGQIDKRIFDEPESQTSKEIDIRAVNARDSYAKNIQTGKDHDSGKENRKGEANEYETLQKQSGSLGKDEEKSLRLGGIAEDEKETSVPSLDEEKVAEVPKKNLSEEEKTYHREESEVERDTVEDESTTGFSNEDSREDNDETIENSRKEESAKAEDSSKEVSSREQDRPKETENGEEEYSTAKSEETSSEEVSMEYRESTEASYESTYEMGADSDYRDSGSSEDATVSSEHLTSEETPSSEERNLEEHDEDEGSVLSDQEESTEGILKFTDELPKDKKEDVLDEVRGSSESIENIAHDYVDDNYEPDNYKERDPSNSNNLSEEKPNKEMLADGKTEDTKKETKEDEPETSTESQKDQTEGTDSPTEESDTEKTDLTEATEETTTTTTTTVRSTPPKLFKPILARKNYNYIPPTTTPNPVIIKPRLSLLNPKPAKPPKSYNDLAPKPVIRKFTLLARKSTTTMAITTITEEDSTETVEAMTTEALTTTTEASRSEENTLDNKLKPLNESEAKIQAPVNSKDDQDPSPSEQKSPSNVKQNEEEGFTPYPVSRLSTLASAVEKSAKEADFSSTEPAKPTSPQSFTLVDLEIVSTTSLPMGLTPDRPEESSSTTVRSTTEEETSIASSTKIMDQVLEDKVTEDAVSMPISEATSTSEATTRRVEEVESTTVRSLSRNLAMLKRQGGFNCLEKEMYRFYGDTRDCRLFHYCSPGFTSRQVLDFRFVCEEGTAFDEESQSCRHDARNEGRIPESGQYAFSPSTFAITPVHDDNGFTLIKINMLEIID